jgi:hypothetical protein
VAGKPYHPAWAAYCQPYFFLLAYPELAQGILVHERPIVKITRGYCGFLTGEL